LKVVTSSAAAFTASTVPLLRSELAKKGATATVTAGDLSLGIRGGGGPPATPGLAPPGGGGERPPPSRPSPPQAYPRQTAAQLAVVFNGPPPVEAMRLRLLVRDAEYVEAMRKRLPDIVARPLAGKLWLVTMIDFPTASRMAVKADLQALKLDAAAAENVALAN